MRSPSGWGDGCHNGRYTWQKSLGVRVFGKLHASALFRTVRQSRGSTAKYVGGNWWLRRCKGLAFTSSHLSRMPQACVGQARGTGLRPRSLRIDRSRCPVGLNWEYQPHLATYATMCLTEVEREFCPASPDSRWDPLTRYLTLIVPGVSVTWWCDALGAATGRQRTCGFPNTRTASDLCHVYGSLWASITSSWRWCHTVRHALHLPREMVVDLDPAARLGGRDGHGGHWSRRPGRPPPQPRPDPDRNARHDCAAQYPNYDGLLIDIRGAHHYGAGPGDNDRTGELVALQAHRSQSDPFLGCSQSPQHKLFGGASRDCSIAVSPHTRCRAHQEANISCSRRARWSLSALPRGGEFCVRWPSQCDLT